MSRQKPQKLRSRKIATQSARVTGSDFSPPAMWSSGRRTRVIRTASTPAQKVIAQKIEKVFFAHMRPPTKDAVAPAREPNRRAWPYSKP